MTKKKSFLKHLVCQIKSIGRLDSATHGGNGDKEKMMGEETRAPLKLSI